MEDRAQWQLSKKYSRKIEKTLSNSLSQIELNMSVILNHEIRKYPENVL